MKAVTKRLNEICRTYHQTIPLNDLLDAVRPVGEPVDVDGTPWAGLLCGRDGRTSIELKGSRRWLHVQWFKFDTGRYEVNAYVS